MAALGAFARLPPTVGLGRWPTPVYPAPGLSVLCQRDVWVKRDDLSSPLGGGNKVRKLELLLAAARRRGATTVLTAGGMGSNHVVATATHGARVGLACEAVVFPQPPEDSARANLLRSVEAGVRLHCVRTRPGVPWALALAGRRAGVWTVAPGGSTPLGCLGYVAAACELKAQIAAGVCPEPDAIYVPLGSGGTVAGLALGCGLVGLRCPVLGVRVVERWLMSGPLVAWLIFRTAALLRSLGVSARPGPWRVVDGYLGAGYGAATPQAREAVRLARELEGLPLETTYGGKAAAALLALRGRTSGPRRPLLWATWGAGPPPRLSEQEAAARLPRPAARWLQSAQPAPSRA